MSSKFFQKTFFQVQITRVTVYLFLTKNFISLQVNRLFWLGISVPHTFVPYKYALFHDMVYFPDPVEDISNPLNK